MPSQIELLGGLVSIDTSELIERSGAAPTDVIVLSGTLLEGFGNLYSDLDLYVIGEQLPAKGSAHPTLLVVREDGRVRRVNETLPGASDIILDVQYYTFQELDTLARSLNTLYSESLRGTGIFRKTLHPEDEDLIHKLLIGKVLQHGTRLFDAHRIFDPGTFCFLKYRNEVGGYSEFRDLIGSWISGDLDTCLYNARAYLIAQVSGMMFLAGSSNPRPKWFVRRLTSLAPKYSQLRDGVMQWMYGARFSDSQKRDAVREACELIDLAYCHARNLLGTNTKYFSAADALVMTEREFAERGTSDRDTMQEQVLRRRMFNDSAPPLSTQFESDPPKRRGAELVQAASA